MGLLENNGSKINKKPFKIADLKKKINPNNKT
jgi:hypothetical protein